MGKYNFTSSLEDSDTIQMDIQAAYQYIDGTMSNDLADICRTLQAFNNSLETMQGRQHSTSGTNVDQDYLDFDALSNALGDFTAECNRVLEDIHNYIQQCERSLYN